MQKTPDKIVKLVEDYESLTSGRVPDSFDEAQLKATFIEPIFEELGWDIRNPSEVVREKRVHIRESTKSADYCFNISGKPQFILEAKDFRKKLNNKDYIFQTKLYGYNLPSPFGILTNFGDFRLYDTGLEPDYDNPARGLVKKYDLTYTDYLEKWDLIYEMFSRSAVEGGSLVELIPKSRRVRNKEALDVKFFESLTEWREDFAKVIALRNPHLNDEYLINEAVQRILDRMIFIRVIEDRGIESIQLLRDALNRWDAEREKPLYRYVVDKFRYLDPHYNGQLFEKHPLSENLIIDDDLVKKFIESLYYPKSPYQFNKIGVEMLGTIYERFLGSTIRLTPAHRAKVEEKPEVRKAGGVYYTPKYIVDYIVENTVGELLKKCKTPRAVANLKILDPACGSGSFLLGAFQSLIDWHEDYYNENPDKIRKGVGPALAGCWYDKETERWRLTAKEKGKILVNNIHGVDIDPSAVEVTIMSLYLKVLEDTDTEFLIKTALLPPLHRNVKCGNSLIGSDYWDFVRERQGELFERILEEERRVNTFDWEDEFEEIMKPRPRHRRGAPQQAGPAPQQAGFDAVIGNPPYVFTRDKGIDEYQKSYFYNNYEHQSHQLNTFGLFIEKCYYLMCDAGILGFIIPNNWLTIDSFWELRVFILKYTRNIKIVNILDRVFAGANVDSAILLFQKGKPSDLTVAEMDKEEEIFSRDVRLTSVKPPSYIIQIGLLKDPNTLRVIEKIESNSCQLNELCKVSTGLKAYQTGKGNPSQGKKEKENRIFHSTSKHDNTYGKYLDGVDVKRYYLSWSGEYLSYGDWLAEPRKSVPFKDARLLIRQIPSKPPHSVNAVFTDEPFYNDINSMVVFSPFGRISLKYILGILNSKPLTLWFIKTYDKLQRKIFPQFKVKELARFPIRTIDFDDPDDVAKHDEMVGLVEEMLSLHERLAGVKSDADRTRLERAIKKTDKKIDTLVYELYGLTEEEIRVVEGS